MCYDGRKRVIQREISDESCFLQRCPWYSIGTSRVGHARVSARLTCSGGLQPTFAKAEEKRDFSSGSVQNVEYLVFFCRSLGLPTDSSA